MSRVQKIFTGVILGVLAVLVALYLADLGLNRGNVPRGTSVGGVNIGGQAPEEAVRTLEAALGGVEQQPVDVVAGAATASFVPAEAGLGIDYDATVAAAGIESANPVSRLRGMLRTYELPAVSAVDAPALGRTIERLQQELHRDPVNAAIAIEAGSAKVREPVDGQDVTTEELHTQITSSWLEPDGVRADVVAIEPEVGQAALSAAQSGPVKQALAGDLILRGTGGVEGIIAKDRIGEILQFDEALAPQINHEAAGAILGEQLAETETPMKNARVLTTGGIEPAVDGVAIDWEQTLLDFDARLIGDAPRTWDATYKDVPASFTTEQAQNATFNEVVGSFTTGGFSGASGENIRLVANTVNGAIVNPGETFSLNGYTGPRGRAQGYVESGIIINGRGGTAVGGGISQFATTLYNAYYFAGMTDVASTPHSYYISRYPAGREATVYEGAIDLAFRNDSANPVKIVTNFGGGQITVSLMGVKTVNVESINGGRWAYTQPQPRTVTGPGCSPSGGAPGFTTSDTRVISDLAGNVLNRETTTTVYDPQPIVRCG